MLPLYVGNLQVTKISRGRDWTLSRVSLGALIRNGMGTSLLLFYSLRIVFEDL